LAGFLLAVIARGSFRVLVDMFSVSVNSGSPVSKHVFHYRLQIPYVLAVMVQFGECQPTPRPEVLQGGVEGFLLKHLAICANLVIH
jgi:hypothetical protein